MNKAAALSRTLEQLDVADRVRLIEKSNEKALWFDVSGDAVCMMHDDGSVNIIEIQGRGVVTCDVISPANVLKVLHHYRPFKGVLDGNLQ